MDYTLDHAGFTARFEALAVERQAAPFVMGGLALCTAWLVWDAGLALGSIVGGIVCALAWWGLGPHLYGAFQRDTLILAHGDLVVERRLIRTKRIPLRLRGLKVDVREQNIGDDNQRIELVLTSHDDQVVLNATFWQPERVRAFAAVLQAAADAAEPVEPVEVPEALEELRLPRPDTARQEA